MKVIDLNNDEVIDFSAKLEKLHRSAFPSAVRNTLNQVGFDMKRTNIVKSAKQNFNRVKSPTFFRKFTVVDKAVGFDINRMSTTVGFVNSTDPKIRRVVSGLIRQEFGGRINDGSRYLKAARGGRTNGKVKQSNYFGNQKFLKGGLKRRSTRKSNFVAMAYASASTGKSFSINTNKGSFVVRTKSLLSNRRSRKTSFKLDSLMMSRDKKPTSLTATRFMSEAAEMSSKKMNSIYSKQAEFQFKKHLK